MTESKDTGGGRLRGAFARRGGLFVCVAGFVLTLAAFYPGVMTPDSIDQLAQAHAWDFYEANPPIMSAVWGIIDRVWPGPAGMLLLNNLLFWGGAALLWRLTRDRSPRLSLAFAFFGFMPQVLAHLGSVLKDTSLGATLLAVSALLYGAGRVGVGRGRVFLLAACPLLFYGYGVRLNAAPAVLPLALWGGFLACRLFPRLASRAASLRALPLLLGLAYFVALTAAVTLASRALTGGRTSYLYQQIMLHDLAAVSKETGRPVFPDYITRAEDFSAERVSELYSTEWINTLTFGSPPPLRQTLNPEEVRSLRAAWWRAVRDNKGAYLSHRWAVFRNLTGLGTPYVYKSFNPSTGKNNPPQFRQTPNALTRALTSYFFLFSNSPLFRGFLYVLACLALAYLSLRLKLAGDLGAVFALSSSGLLYAAAYFFAAPASDFRYLWWTVIAATVAATLFALHLREHRGLLRARRARRGA